MKIQDNRELPPTTDLSAIDVGEGFRFPDSGAFGIVTGSENGKIHAIMYQKRQDTFIEDLFPIDTEVIPLHLMLTILHEGF
jgi:hypothetical protein